MVEQVKYELQNKMEKFVRDMAVLYISVGYKQEIAEQMAEDELMQHLDSLPASIGNILYNIWKGEN